MWLSINVLAYYVLSKHFLTIFNSVVQIDLNALGKNKKINYENVLIKSQVNRILIIFTHFSIKQEIFTDKVNRLLITECFQVNTEACEQLFSWFSCYKYITKHMNRHNFLFLVLYLMENHNIMHTEGKLEKESTE